MLKWLDKVRSLWKEENEQEVRKTSSNSVEAESPIESIDIKTKVKYQYPEKSDLFPVLQETKQKPPKRIRRNNERNNETTFNKKNNTSKRNKEQEKEESVPLIEKPLEEKQWEKALKAQALKKRPFYPTEVPSPVYGFNRRKKQIELDAIPEFELKSNWQPTFVVDTDGIEQQTFIEEKETNEVLLKVEDTSVELEENNFYDENSDSHELIEVVEVAEISEMDEAEIVQQEEEITLVTTTSSNNNREIDSKNQTVSNRQREERKRSPIPYNVLMLKQDRRMLEKKKVEQQSPSMNESTYKLPTITLLNPPIKRADDNDEWVEEQRRLLNETLHHFKVGATVVNATQGPSVTQFEVHPEPGVKVNKITNLSDDIKLSLAAKDIRMEAPIPGKNTIGIEVPNRVSQPVVLREIVRHPSFIQNPSPLAVALGLDIAGSPVVLDLQKMPHGLIAGATGSGKSVCVNSIIISLLYKARPDEVKLLLIDPKMVELTPYNHIPHLVSPVITDVKAATAALKWAVEEMERRYELFVHAQVRDIARFNEKALSHNQEKLPYLVIIIDELSDLMMMAPGDVEESICRIAQKARACGIHLLIATQRPSVDVITGLIKANVPTRIAFSVSSQVDSRTIIDIGGAERLLGRGDMLLLENGATKPRRVQGNFVSDEEMERIVEHVKQQQKPNYLFQQEELLQELKVQEEEDDLFYEACEFVVEQTTASTSSLQRKFRIGYNRAARLIDMMEANGIITGANGSKARDVLISERELHNKVTNE
ncbi:DNA translocase FtsK [Bacillus sp. FJAT-45066]|uniref:DNA translocase FtsK n=1 Tax=Bacillus sp. FJAT-45066 TaxID=2011010 RepID=UPI000BB712B5|nr:DNA translocase FtsK [Bacillus sp. FJAT-45066]